MADTEIVETPPTQRMIPDFDAELSEVFRKAFPDQEELEDLIFNRVEKGLRSPKVE